MAVQRSQHPGPFAVKSVEALVAETEERGHALKRAVGALDMTAIGVGTIIGSGIFIVIGAGADRAGAAVFVSFAVAAFACFFSALAYAELSSTIPVTGSAFTFTYAILGELIAWLIGWNLIAEFAVATAASAVGWGANLNAFLVTTFNTTISPKLTTAPAEGGTLNLLAVVIVAAIAALLIKGVRETARTNNIMVAVKLTTLVFFVVAGLTAFVSGNFTPFAPNGLHGIVRGASLVFFAFLGFEAVAAGSEEVKNPKRDLPLAIIGALAIATLFYMVVSVTAIGLVPAHRLASSEAPLADALEHGTGLSWAASVTSGGATVAITSVLLGAFYTTTRIVFAMARDGLVPGAWARVNQTTGTPILLTLSLAALIGVAAALLSLTTLFQLVNIGTLSAFAAINFGVIVLRRTRPDLPRPFRVPFVPVFPLIGIAVCIYLMFQLPGTTWERWAVWTAVGLAIYGFFGYRNSRLRREPEAVEAGHPDLHQHR